MSSALPPSTIRWEILPFRFYNDVILHVPGLPLDYTEFAEDDEDE